MLPRGRYAQAKRGNTAAQVNLLSHCRTGILEAVFDWILGYILLVRRLVPQARGCVRSFYACVFTEEGESVLERVRCEAYERSCSCCVVLRVHIHIELFRVLRK